ncbi:MAG: hypothetical protein WCX75_06170 [Fibrobacteraceae bacterium]
MSIPVDPQNNPANPNFSKNPAKGAFGFNRQSNNPKQLNKGMKVSPHRLKQG